MIRLLCLALLLLSGPAGATQLLASLDRDRLDWGDQVDLTLASDDATLFGKPDLSPLDGDFDVLGTRQENRFGDSSRPAGTRWVITLRPRRAGFLVIPALRLGEVRSQALTLHVAQPGSSAAERHLDPVFIDASLDREQVYVQAQVILTLRIFHSVPLYDDSSLAALQMDDARVEPLGGARVYEREIAGTRHGVIERRYALYPQHSGALKIPGQVFSATLVDTDTATQGGFAQRPSRMIRVRSPEIPLQVLPRPASYPAEAVWLPARRLSLEEHWTPAEPNVAVGESLTRTLSLRAEGLPAAQLQLPEAPLRGELRSYPEPAQGNDSQDENGLNGSLQQSQALLATAAGHIEVEALRLPWWNTETDQLEYAELPARRLEVSANPAAVAPSAPEAATQVSDELPLLWPWQLACALLSGTTLLGFGLYWRARRRPAVESGRSVDPRLLEEVQRACRAGDPQASRQALDAWARQQPETLAQMAARNAPLSQALDELNGALYASEADRHWSGETLWRALRKLPEAGADDAHGGALPPLYPDARSQG